MDTSTFLLNLAPYPNDHFVSRASSWCCAAYWGGRPEAFWPIFEAMMQSRQLQAGRIVGDSVHFAQQAQEYELQLAAEKANTVSVTKPDTTGSISMPIKRLAY